MIVAQANRDHDCSFIAGSEDDHILIARSDKRVLQKNLHINDEGNHLVYINIDFNMTVKTTNIHLNLN